MPSWSFWMIRLGVLVGEIAMVKWVRNNIIIPWLLLGVGLLGTAIVSVRVEKGIERDWTSQFAFTCDQVTDKIQIRLDAYALILRGGAALFAATGSVTRQEWRAYIETLRVSGSVLGAQGLGFAQAIASDQLASHIAQVRSEGFPDYTVFPPGKRALYAPVVFIEPFREPNLRAFGYDVYSEPIRRAAMDFARDTGEAALTGKVELVQETGTDNRAGVLMYEPVYRSGAEVNTVAQRRAALIGWVNSPYRLQDLMGGILGNWESREGKTVNLRIFDGLEAMPAKLLFENQPKIIPYSNSLFRQQRVVSFHGQRWLLKFERRMEAVSINYALAWSTLVSGIFLSGLLFGLVRSAINTKANANRIASQLTEEIRFREEALRESEEKIRLLLDSAAEGIYGIDVEGDCTFCNAACLRLLGYQHPDELIGKNMHWLIHGKHADGTFFPVEECRIFNAFVTGTISHVDDEVLWRSDGTAFHAEYWSSPQTRDGVVAGAVVSFLDITARKNLENIVAHSRNLLLAVVDAAPVRVFWKDADLCYLGCNLAFAKDAGMAHPRDLIGKDDYQMLWAAQADRYRADDRDVMESGIAKLSYDEPLPTPCGNTIWVRTSKVPLRNGSNEVCGIVGVFEDITLRKQIEEELRISQDMLNLICSSAQDGVIMLDEAGNVALWSNSAERIFKFSREEMNGRDMHDIIVPPSSKNAFRQAFPHFQQTGEGNAVGTTFDSIGIRKGGKNFPVEISLSAVRTARGWCSIGIVRDITERKQLQDSLARSAAEMSATLYSIGDAVIALDNLGCVVLMNPVAVQLTGWSESEAQGKPIDEVFCVVNARTLAPIVSPVNQVIEQKLTIGTGFRLRLTARGGTERIISENTAPILDQLNNLTGVVVVFRDLTTQIEAEQTTLNQLAIIETYEGLVALADMEGRLIYINAGGTQMIGAAGTEQILGENLAQFTQLSNFLISGINSPPSANAPKIWNGENILTRTDGNTIPVAQTLFIISDVEGNAKHIGVIMMDISPMKEMQEKLLMSEKLSAMGLVLADVAHELNNPLAIIIGRVELMISQIGQPSSLMGKSLESVLQSARRCKGLLSNLLAYRPAFGERTDAINLPYLVNEAIGNVHHQFDMGSVNVVTHYNLTDVEVAGNRVALLSVLVNVLSNARQAIGTSGSICITAVALDEAQLAIEIEDTGIGMSEGQLGELFQPFWSGWREGKGNGLGLAISRGIIETHGGKLWAESKGEGEGAKFTILLPYKLSLESVARMTDDT